MKPPFGFMEREKTSSKSKAGGWLCGTYYRETVAEKHAAYLQHELTLANLVDWAESALMDGEFDSTHMTTI